MNIIRRPFKYVNYHVVYWLIGINILLFAARMLLGQNIRLYLEVYLPMRPVVVIHYKWIWTFITYMFMHADFSHVFFNMFGLFIFGTHVERQMGSWEFLVFYLVTGTLAGFFSFLMYLFTDNIWVVLVGASGAIYAVQLAFAVMNPNAVINIWGILPLRAPVMVLVFTVLSLFFIVSGTGGNVAHLTHLAGFAFGWLYFMVRYRINPMHRLFRR